MTTDMKRLEFMPKQRNALRHEIRLLKTNFCTNLIK